MWQVPEAAGWVVTLYCNKVHQRKTPDVIHFCSTSLIGGAMAQAAFTTKGITARVQCVHTSAQLETSEIQS